MTARCEPPPELREVDGWHWVQEESDEDTPVCWQWSGDGSLWWAYGARFDGANASRAGYRYLTPVTPPA